VAVEGGRGNDTVGGRGVAMWATVSILLSAGSAWAAPDSLGALFPGRWVPAQVGIVREHDAAEDTWGDPRIQVILRWEPEDADRLRWLDPAECAEAAFWACHAYGARTDSCIMGAGPEVPGTGSTTLVQYGGAPETRLLFALPGRSTPTIDICVRQDLPRGPLQEFEIAAPLTGDPPPEWRTGPVAWRVGSIATDTYPPPTAPVLDGLGPRRAGYSREIPALLRPPPKCTTRVVLHGFPKEWVAFEDLHLRMGTLRSGDDEWPPLLVTLAFGSKAANDPAKEPVPPIADEDPNAKPPFWLLLWFPVEELPADSTLALKGSFIRRSPEERSAERVIEHVYTDLPLPRGPL